MAIGHEITNEIVDGIEWVSYTLKEPTDRPPILFQHGMWHGAWCWSKWQELLAERGWESHAISLPGHGNSVSEKSVRFATMGHYLDVLEAAIGRLSPKPVLIGHSMGGALAQWRLKKIADDLPGVVLAASWTSHSTWADGTALHMKRDPWGFFLVGLTMSTDPLIRDAERAASMLITDGALFSADELHSKLVSESALVLNQHNPPFWRPLKNPKTPILWVGAEKDAVVSIRGARRSAEFYGAEFALIENAGHNLMMEANYEKSLSVVEDWLQRNIA